MYLRKDVTQCTLWRVYRGQGYFSPSQRKFMCAHDHLMTFQITPNTIAYHLGKLYKMERQHTAATQILALPQVQIDLALRLQFYQEKYKPFHLQIFHHYPFIKAGALFQPTEPENCYL